MNRLAYSVLTSLLLIAPFYAQSQSWTQVGGQGVFEFATSPDYANDGRVWFASGSLPYQGDGAIRWSIDHGNTFPNSSVLPGGPHDTMGMAVSPTYALDSTLVAMSIKSLAPASSFWKSTDGGVNWVEQPQPSPTWGNFFTTAALSPSYADDQTILAACQGVGCNTMRSTDGGATWTSINASGNPGSDFLDIEFAKDFATSGLAFGIDALSRRFYRSQNGGEYFTECLGYGGLPCPTMSEVRGIELTPQDEMGRSVLFYFGSQNSIFGNFNNVLRSLDDGLSWFPVGTGLVGLDVYDLVAADDYPTSHRLYAGTSAGVFVSEDEGLTFASLAAPGLPNPVTQLELAGGPIGDLYALAGSTATTAGNLYRLRLAGTGTVNLGNALAGVAGPPSLSISTNFGNTRALSVLLSQAAPAAPSLHVFGLTSQYLPFLGGVLVPTVNSRIRSMTNSTGQSGLNLAWPPAFLTGHQVFVQAWILDAQTPKGYSASNALQLTRL